MGARCPELGPPESVVSLAGFTGAVKEGAPGPVSLVGSRCALVADVVGAAQALELLSDYFRPR